MSSFPLVMKKLISISRVSELIQVSSLNQLTSLVFKKLTHLETNRRIKEFV